MKHLPRVCL